MFDDASGRRMLLSPPGWIWRIAVSDENALSDCVRHDALRGVYRTERSLVLRPATQFGSLHLAVVDEQGAPFEYYGFYLRCLDRDLNRNYDRMVPPADGMYRDLPAGRWRLTIGIGRDLPYRAPGARTRGTEEHDITIEDGRTTDLKVVTRPVGRVGFRLRADVPLGELEDLKIRAEPSGAELKFDTILPENLMPAPVGASRVPLLLASQALPAGKCWFVVSANGFQPARCEAELVADRAVECELELIRR